MFESLTGADLAAAMAAANGGAASGGPAGRRHADPAGSDGLAGQSLGELVDRVTAADRLMSWATGMQARAVAGLAAGYEAHHLADLPAAASGEHRGEARAEAIKDCVVELGLARVTRHQRRQQPVAVRHRAGP
jgi:hypothetical protein